MSATDAGAACDDLPERPPSIPEGAWDAIPHALRRAFLEEAAVALVGGRHPMDVFAEFAAQQGFECPEPPPVRVQPPTRRPPPPRPAPPRAPSLPACAPPSPVAPPPSAGGERDSRSAGPKTTIGAAIQKAARLPASIAAEAEESVLVAIAADPAMSYWDPSSVRQRGGRITVGIAEAISELIRAEASRRIEGIRFSAASGDADAAGWDDPDAWQCSRIGP